MAGYVNSWIEKYQQSPPACIGDTINQSNSSQYGLGPIANCWMWLIIGAIAGYVIKDKKK